MKAPFFLITVDTEGDDLWARSHQITTRNARWIPRFQSLCETHGLRPTYLTNYEMACSAAFRELGADVLRRNAGEIGMHLHAWNSPPIVSLTRDDFVHHPYLPEYPEPVMREKIRFMTALLEDTFGVKMRSHRAGRWCFDERYARLLIEHGYRVDCSVTPHVSWTLHKGDPTRAGGRDYSHFPERAYFVDCGDIGRPGSSSLLEVPMTIRERGRWLARLCPMRSTIGRVVNRLYPRLRWLRPNGHNRAELLALVDDAVARGEDYVEFMIHSSELMPGGSPTFRSARSIERLYDDLEALFSRAAAHTRAATLAELADRFERAEPTPALSCRADSVR